MAFSKWCTGVLIGGLCFPYSSWANTEPAQQAAALPELVVTASAEPSEIRTLPSTVQVLSSEQLQRSGADTLDKVLERYVPGNGAMQPGGFAAVGLRGFRSNQSAGSSLSDRVLILIDGHRSGTGNPNFIPMANVERVEIIRGPSSVLYGGSAMGGVINVITKRGKGEPTGSIGASYGSNRKRTGEAGVSSGLDNDRWGYSIGVQGTASGDYKDGEGQRYDNSGYHNTSVGGTVTFRPESGSSLSLVTAHQAMFDTGSPGYYDTGLTPEDEARDTFNYLALEFDKALESDLTLQASLYASRNRYDFYDATWSQDNSTYRTDTLGGKSILGMPFFDWGRLALGVDYSHIREKNYGSAVFQPSAAYDVFGLFAEHRLDVGSVSFISGVRYDVYRNRIKDTNRLTTRPDSETYDHVSWNVGATWWFLDWLGLRASAGSAFVPPSAKDIAGNFQTSGLWGVRYKGNPDLKPERSLTGEIGLEVEYEGLHGSLSWFYTRYKDRITPEFRNDAMMCVNTGDQRLSGFDISASYNKSLDMGLPHPLELAPYVNSEIYTLRRNMDTHRATITPINVPEHSTVAGLGIGSGQGVGRVWFDVNARITGSQLQNNTTTFTPDRMSGYTVYNTRLTVTPLESLDVYLDVSNITDKQYAYTWGYPMPGREVSLGMKYIF